MSIFINFSSVSFSYENSQNILFDNLNLTFQEGWTGLSGSNGTGKTTLLSLILGTLTPDSGKVIKSGNVVYCPQLYEPLTYEDYPYIYDYSKETLEYKRLLGVEDEMFLREESLSGGEKKRIQLFSALSKNPDILLLDEPTNHLDIKSKNYILSALRQFKGVGIIISHDRNFMSKLSERTLLFFKQGKDKPTLIEKYPLPLDKALEESDRIQTALLEEKSIFKERVNSLSNTISSVDKEIKDKKGNLSKRNLSQKDHDGKGKVDMARLSGKDRGLSDRKAVLQNKKVELENEMNQIAPRLKSKTGLDHYIFKKPHSDFFIESFKLCAGEYELKVPTLTISAGEHIAILGDNGAGKSLFIRALYNRICDKYGKEKVLYIKQEYNADDYLKIQAYFDSLPSQEKAQVISDLYRLGSKAEAFYDAVSAYSPGEMKKLSLVLGMQKECSIIILDEPTNHLDVIATRLLESILKKAEATIVVASHDIDFINAITSRTFNFKREGSKGFILL